ncbi:MAG: outer-membrane lipoprotein carrier protein LolA [Pseudomonadota bacterium]
MFHRVARAVVVAASLSLIAPAVALAQDAERAALANVSAYFNSLKTMQGEFVQFGPDGSRTQGRFAIQRPGKVRFYYDRPSTLDIIADGTSVAVRDRKQATQDIWPLNRTPLRFLLDDTIDLASDAKVTDVSVEPDLVSVTVEENSAFGDGQITMMFDAETSELKQWNVVDSKGQETSVSIFNVDTGMTLSADLFKIDYTRILD